MQNEIQIPIVSVKKRKIKNPSTNHGKKTVETKNIGTADDYTKQQRTKDNLAHGNVQDDDDDKKLYEFGTMTNHTKQDQVQKQNQQRLTATDTIANVNTRHQQQKGHPQVKVTARTTLQFSVQDRRVPKWVRIQTRRVSSFTWPAEISERSISKTYGGNQTTEQLTTSTEKDDRAEICAVKNTKQKPAGPENGEPESTSEKSIRKTNTLK